MRSGRLRQRVTIERRTRTRDRFGAIVETWETHASRAANVATPTGREAVAADQLRAELSHVLTLRAPLDVTTTDRIVYRGRVLGILAVLDTDNRGRELTLYAAEVVPNGPAAN